MIRSLSLGKTFCISNKHDKYYMASLIISLQGNDTDFHSTIKMGVGGKNKSVWSKNQQHWRSRILDSSPRSAMTWHGHGRVTWNIFLIELQWILRGRDETFPSYLVPLSLLTDTESKVQPFLGSLWAISLLPSMCILVCSLSWNAKSIVPA